MDSRLEQLIAREESLFSKRENLCSLWQDVSENFYPERANFTYQKRPGTEFASGLMMSYPLIARRDLGNSFSALLRPSTADWFEMSVGYEDNLDYEGRRWLQYATSVQRRAMFDRVAQFARASKECDHDIAAFGQGVVSIDLNKNGNALLYRCWHLRDCAWAENYEGRVDTIFRRWEPTIRELVQLFGDKVPSALRQRLEKEPFATVNCVHCVLPSTEFEVKGKYDFASVYYIKGDHKSILESIGIRMQNYVVPRWQTVSGSQYAYSPATVVALPDARLIQAMTRVLLEAGEKAVDPPMIAVQEAIRSDISVYAGGITWVDRAYDERLGEVLRPLTQDKSGMPLGLQMQQDTRLMIMEAFFLNKLTLPPPVDRMTAYEASQRVAEYIRQAAPLFEPLESEYNAALCEVTFEILLRGGAFGNPREIPRSLMGQDIQFKFQNPFRAAADEQKAGKLLQANNMLAQAAAVDPSSSVVLDAKVALRDALYAIGTPVKWLRSEEEVEAMVQKEEAMKQAQVGLAGLQQGAEIAKTYSEAAATGQQAGVV